MKWDSLAPMGGALLGSLITGGALVVTQINEQHHEDTRQMRILAYEMAMKEWQFHASKGEANEIPNFGDILLNHLEYSYVARKYGADAKSEEYAGLILDNMLDEYFTRRKPALIREEQENHTDAGNNAPQNKIQKSEAMSLEMKEDPVQ